MASETVRPLHVTTRMVHCFAIAHLLGRPGAADIVDHGMEAIRTRHRDPRHGGYFWSFDDEGPRERDKLAYGHAFVLLAAASAKCVGHPEADALLSDIAEVLETRFWEPKYGASAEEFAEDWSPFSAYRGQNANMHLTEALMAAFEATAERGFLDKAESIADLILRRNAAAADWRVPEHYSRRLDGRSRIQGLRHVPSLWRHAGPCAGMGASGVAALGARRAQARLAARRGARACSRGRSARAGTALRGGFYYTLEWSGAPRVRDRLWWPCCEGIGAATFLGALDGDAALRGVVSAPLGLRCAPFHRSSPRRLACQLDDSLRPIDGYFVGKPDLYHALQACLIPLYPTTGSLTRGILRAPGARLKRLKAHSPSNSAVDR